MKKIALAAVMMVFAVVFAASSAFAFGTGKFKDEVEKEIEAVNLVRDVAEGGYNVITTTELNELMKTGEDILIIDTMPYEDSYKKGHIPTAKQFLFPIPDMVEWDSQQTDGKSQQEYLQLLGPDTAKKIVVYCGFVKCTRSHNGALWAKKLGYTNVYRYPGGIFAWKGADFDMEKVK
ncbi:rhodanese-like domain-containing protein [Desulfocastanea catecholica]